MPTYTNDELFDSLDHLPRLSDTAELDTSDYVEAGSAHVGFDVYKGDLQGTPIDIQDLLPVINTLGKVTSSALDVVASQSKRTPPPVMPTPAAPPPAPTPVAPSPGTQIQAQTPAALAQPTSAVPVVVGVVAGVAALGLGFAMLSSRRPARSALGLR